MKACRQKGRWINVAISFGVDLQDIFKLGVRFETQSRLTADGNNNINNNEHDKDEDEDEDDIYSLNEEKVLLNVYQEIKKFIPKLNKILPYLANANETYFYDVVDAVRAHTSCGTVTNMIQMQEGCNAARSENIRRIKDNTTRYLAAGQTPVRVGEHTNHKALRGLNDENIGRLIIPVEDLHEWDQDPDGYAY